MSSHLSASILARLLAKTRGDDYSLLLNRFALERLLFRISRSPHADRFLLKGALLFALWYDDPHRPTRDADLLGFGPDDADKLVATFRDIAAMDLGDGMVFDPESVRANAIREDNTYGGTRIHLLGRIGSARCALQIDVGYGDAVTPAAETVTFPTLLQDFQAPVLRVYPVYTVIAEKYQAMVMLGQANSRMKDFYDLAVIGQRHCRHVCQKEHAAANRAATGADPSILRRPGQSAPMAGVSEQEPHHRRLTGRNGCAA